ncbi:MAG: hypothetical protein RMM58_06495 [Chloroflexota bacterium]|nr:hypothetical protein [Dehalococcoidia bacterium]MDW8253510.1 hypothetical protein [Chloroflexota bacterium]
MSSRPLLSTSALAIIVAALALALGVTEASANGLGEIRVADAPVGSYRLTVATSPSPLEAGDALLTILVQDEHRFPVLDAAVSVRAAREGEPLGPPLSARTGLVANRLLYAVTVPLDRPGRWQLLIRVEGSAGSGELPLALDVSPPGPLRFLGPAVLIALPSLLVIAGFLARRARYHRESKQAVSSHLSSKEGTP